MVEVVQPAGVRAGRLGGMHLFEGFGREELEAFAVLLGEIEVAAGTRLTVQGRSDERLWLISEGEALVSADARPLRVIGHGGAAGVAGMLYSIASPETTTALRPVRALSAGRAEFEKLLRDPRLRRRLAAVAGDQDRSRRHAKLR